MYRPNPGMGVDELLDQILVQAEVLELKAHRWMVQPKGW
jgi:hypothetical protein